MNRAKAALQFIDGSADPSKLVRRQAPLPGGRHAMTSDQMQAQELLNMQYLKDKFGVNIDQLRNTPGLFGQNDMLTDAAILGGGSLALTGVAGLGGADGGDAVGAGLLGAGLAAAPSIHNAVRDPRYRTKGLRGRDLVGLVAAGAGAGTGSSLLLDALGL